MDLFYDTDKIKKELEGSSNCNVLLNYSYCYLENKFSTMEVFFFLFIREKFFSNPANFGLFF